MQIMITQTTQYAGGYAIEAICGRVSASVAIEDCGVAVCCLNASHGVGGRRGPGNYFFSTSKALAHYKSSEMKAIIQTAIDEDAAAKARASALPISRTNSFH
jgi:hypothetical protein